MTARNFIFDIGNVLISFQPRQYLAGLFDDESTQLALHQVIFESAEWVGMDRGTISHTDATALFTARRPELEGEIQLAMAHLRDMLTPIESTIELLPRIAAAGHGLYYLSNYHAELVPYIQRRYDCFQLFRGGVFSCDVHSVKSEPEIYQIFLQKYQLDPSTCVFFDDMQPNIDGAIRAGMEAILFTGVQDVERCL